jgi:hypothetical protein
MFLCCFGFVINIVQDVLLCKLLLTHRVSTIYVLMHDTGCLLDKEETAEDKIQDFKLLQTMG